MKNSLCLLLFLSMFAVIKSSPPCRCPFTERCTSNPLKKIYPNQNMCLLLHEVPKEIRRLPYVTLPTCQRYDVLRFNFNKRFNIFPHAILTPRNACEVAQALTLLRRHKLEFAIRSCGHCFGPGSLSSAYVIDLGHFRELKPNSKEGTVYIGTGNRLGYVIQELGKLNYAISTGTCPSVGAGGLVLGGGLGLLSRQLGLTCDSILSFTVIDAKSNIIEVTKKSHPDLFYALCGAGNGSYGIVIGFTSKMYYIPRVTYVELEWDWDPELVPRIMETWQSWITTLPSSISTEMHVRYLNGKAQFSIIGLKLGTKPFTEWQKVFKPFKPHVSIRNERYIDAAKQAASRYTEPFSKAKSKFLFKPLSSEGIAVIVEYINELLRQGEDFLVYLEIGAARGAITKKDTAYFPREALMWFFQFIYWNFEKQNARALSSLNGFYERISPFCSPYSYANLVDYDLGKSYLHAYYGDHVGKLIRIKDKYDPKNVFRWKQSIPTSQSLS